LNFQYEHFLAVNYLFANGTKLVSWLLCLHAALASSSLHALSKSALESPAPSPWRSQRPAVGMCPVVRLSWCLE